MVSNKKFDYLSFHRLVRPVGVWCERVGPADGESEITTAKRQLPWLPATTTFSYMLETIGKKQLFNALHSFLFFSIFLDEILKVTFFYKKDFSKIRLEYCTLRSIIFLKSLRLLNHWPLYIWFGLYRVLNLFIFQNYNKTKRLFTSSRFHSWFFFFITQF